MRQAERFRSMGLINSHTQVPVFSIAKAPTWCDRRRPFIATSVFRENGIIAD
jgi:hypothetical protein